MNVGRGIGCRWRDRRIIDGGITVRAMDDFFLSMKGGGGRVMVGRNDLGRCRDYDRTAGVIVTTASIPCY